MSALRLALVSTAVAVACLASVRPVLATDERKACAAASEDAQLQRIKGHLVAARTQLLACARDECPALVKHDCDSWLAEVDASLPTLVLAAKDGSGRDIGDVIVRIDGAPLLDRLDGKAVAVDAGQHVLHFEHAGEAPVEQTIIVHEGQKNRLVLVSFGPTPPVPAPDVAPAPTTLVPVPLVSPPAPLVSPPQEESHPRPVPAAAWILGGLGVAALGTALAFEIDQLETYDHDRNTCATTTGCEVSPIKTERIVAGVSLGVGIAALAAGAVVFFTSRAPHDKAAAWEVNVTPERRGGGASLVGRF